MSGVGVALGFLSLDLITKAKSAVTKAEWVSVPECTRTDIVARKMEYNDSSVLIIVINIDITEILIELSDDCTRVVDFMRKMTVSH